MSVRDEIAEMLYGDAWNSVRAQREVASIMPIVERVAREAAIASWAACVFCERGDKDYESTDDIVRRVCG